MSKKNLRIDYSKYEVEEVVETISGAILFPLYIGEVAIKVVLFFLVLIGGLAYFFTSHFLTGLLFFFLSWVVSTPSVVIISAIQLLNTIRDDINKVVAVTLETTKHIYDDANLLKEQRQSGVSAKSSFNDVFRGVSLYVIRPSLKKVLERRIKFFAGPFIWLIDVIFKYAVIKKQPTFEIPVEEAPENRTATKSEKLVTKAKDGGSKVTSVTLGVIKYPLMVMAIFYGIINVLIVGLLGWAL